MKNSPGIGMWINRLIVEAMKGKLEIFSSRASFGTRYILTLPIVIRNSFND